MGAGVFVLVALGICGLVSRRLIASRRRGARDVVSRIYLHPVGISISFWGIKPDALEAVPGQHLGRICSRRRSSISGTLGSYTKDGARAGERLTFVGDRRRGVGG